MVEDTRKALIRRFYDEAWNRGDLAVIDELFAREYTDPVPDSPRGPEGARRHVAMIRAEFPDLRIVLDELLVEGETVAARWTMTGTDTSGFMGRAPTGQQVNIWGVDFFHFDGDRISGTWRGVDMLGMMIQLGIVPSPWPTEGPGTAPEA